MIRWIGIALLSIAGFAASFVAVLYLAPGGRGPSAPVERSVEYGSIEHNERFDDPSIMSGALTFGWGKQEPWGVWMAGREATITVETDARARDDVQLVLEGRGPGPGRPSRILTVSVNDTPVGEADLDPNRSDIARRMAIPRDVFNRRWPPAITLRVDTDEPQAFGVRRIDLRDSGRIRLTRGFVDGCEQGRVFGWATADDLSVPVIVSANGQRLAGRMKVVERPDLAQLRLPRDAGFELIFAAPLPKGTEVSVTFPGGRPLDHSPCRVG